MGGLGPEARSDHVAYYRMICKELVVVEAGEPPLNLPTSDVFSFGFFDTKTQ